MRNLLYPDTDHSQGENLPRSAFGIKKRLLAGFTAIILIVLAAFSLMLTRMDTIEKITHQFIEKELPINNTFYDLELKIYYNNALFNDWLNNRNSETEKILLSTWSNIEKLQSKMNTLSKTWKEESYINTWRDIQSLLNKLKMVQENALNNNISSTTHIKAESNTIINQILNKLDGPLNHVYDRAGGIIDLQYNHLQDTANQIMNDMSIIKAIEYLMLITMVICAVFISWITANKILTPINKAVQIAKSIASGERHITIKYDAHDETGVLLLALNALQKAIQKSEEKLRTREAETREHFNKIVKTANLFSIHSSKVAAGDLTQRLENTVNDEMGSLGKDLNAMTESLASMTQQITGACHDMVSTLEEVKHAVNIQSSGATQQASSINQITASLGEIEKSSNQTIEKAKSLGEVATRTREKGQMGLEAVEQSILGMKSVKNKVELIAQTIFDLSNKTQQVGEITAVVNGLAQQSKMLALNASIEAAKAGEAGKGFAVVASEVKSLAEQSEQSTAQVQKILEDIRHATEKAVMATEEGTKGVDYGRNLVEQTGDIVRSLSEVISETTIATQQIEAAVRQESIGIEQITAGMNEINQVTTEFVENAKQTTESINYLASISHHLKEHVDVYKI